MRKKNALVTDYPKDLDNRVIEFEEKWDQLRLMIAMSDFSDDDKHKMLDLSFDLIEIFYDLEDIEI